MWATVLGLMMQRLVLTLLINMQAAVGVDVGNRPGSDDATVGLNTVLICVQAAVGVDVGKRPGSDDATVGGPTGHCDRPSSSRGLLHCSHLCAGCCGC